MWLIFSCFFLGVCLKYYDVVFLLVQILWSFFLLILTLTYHWLRSSRVIKTTIKVWNKHKNGIYFSTTYPPARDPLPDMEDFQD